MDLLNQKDFMKSLRHEVGQYFLKNKVDNKGSFKMYFKSIFMFSLYFVPYFLMIFGIA